MPFHRLLARTIVAVIASLALIGGVTPVATAAAGTVARAGTSMTSAEHCAKEKKDVKRAKKRLAKAKKAERNRAAKVKKAKANLKKQKRQRHKWCTQAKNEQQATDQADATKALWDALRKSPAVQALPKDVQTQMFGAVAKVMTLANNLKTDQIPGADPAQLDQIVSLLQSLDPSELQTATDAFIAEIKSSGSPDTLSSLLSALTGTTLPGSASGSELAQLKAAMQSVIDALSAFDPTGGKVAVDTLVQAIKDATAGLQQAATSGSLEQLVQSATALNGGETPTPEQLTQLLTFLFTGTGELPFPMPTDVAGLAALDGLLSSVQDMSGGAPLPGADLLVAPLTTVIEDLVAGGVDLGTIGGAVDPGGVIGGIIGGLIP